MAIAALKVVTSLNSSFITAGTPFTITTEVTNAHDEKVEILEYFFHIPYQVQWIHDPNYDKAYEELQQRNPLGRWFAKSPWKKASQPPGQTMRFANLQDPEQAIQSILPGEAMSFSFKALVPNWLFTTGTEITFEGLISYRYKNERHSSPLRVSFVLRPPLAANIIGAILGGVLGTTAKYLREFSSAAQFDLSFISSSALAVILGVIMVVFSSRSTGNVQPILTVEDFWGGMLAGFLVGYLGHDFFGKVVTPAGG